MHGRHLPAAASYPPCQLVALAANCFVSGNNIPLAHCTSSDLAEPSMLLCSVFTVPAAHELSNNQVLQLVMRFVLQEFVELHIFAGAQKVVADLRNHDCTAALSWCDENRSRVKNGVTELALKADSLNMVIRLCRSL